MLGGAGRDSKGFDSVLPQMARGKSRPRSRACRSYEGAMRKTDKVSRDCALPYLSISHEGKGFDSPLPPMHSRKLRPRSRAYRSYEGAMRKTDRVSKARALPGLSNSYEGGGYKFKGTLITSVDRPEHGVPCCMRQKFPFPKLKKRVHFPDDLEGGGFAVSEEHEIPEGKSSKKMLKVDADLYGALKKIKEDMYRCMSGDRVRINGIVRKAKKKLEKEGKGSLPEDIKADAIVDIIQDEELYNKLYNGFEGRLHEMWKGNKDSTSLTEENFSTLYLIGEIVGECLCSE
jgi:hypothetical protein